ncbi:MaoC family dehydratase [Anaerosphaera multitolerans]|uniref:MaoC family dehydratase n=1 Tax=Anaerosphaera multitolerans TaxID=2487351 RepID=UPI0023EA607A|nr:MaoC family dehydratase [Anaerosphaera multitolerans]
MEKTFTREDVVEFSKLSLDVNPIHLDEEYAKNSIFKQNIVHGLLVSSLISAVLANKLPGNGTIYMSQELKFVKPVFFGDKCIATVEVVEKKDNKNIIILDTKVYTNDTDNVVITGQAVVKKP